MVPPHRTGACLIALWIALAGLSGCAHHTQGTVWQPGAWNGETAWISDSGPWRAVVSEERGRLVFLGRRDGTPNLLYTPAKPKEFASRGGHLFWLGPQREWNRRWGGWPPPDEWEFLPAKSVRPKGDALWVTMREGRAGWPRLRRTYRWEGDTLLVRCAWRGGKGDFQAIQILQLPFTAQVEVRQGRDFLRFDSKGQQTPLSPAKVEEIRIASGGTALLRAGEVPRKFGFRPQPLVATIGSCRLVFERGVVEGRVIDEPDQGFDSQVYLGDKDLPVVELEQLSARLRNRGAKENAFTTGIRLEAVPGR